MASPLDRYTIAFLLSAYGFNDYCLKPKPRSETYPIDSALNTNSRLNAATGSSFKGVNLRDAAIGSSFKEVNVQGTHRLVHGIRAGAGAHRVVHDVSHASSRKLAVGVAQKEPVGNSMVAMHKVVDTTLARNHKSASAGQMVGCLDPVVVGQVQSIVPKVDSSTPQASIQ
ncbi:hypothetical protein TorRG33x02_022700, partial [Trema orientale]